MLIREPGAIFSEVPEGDDPSKYKFVGSTLIVLATDRDDVLGQLKGDIYHENGVWDLEKVGLCISCLQGKVVLTSAQVQIWPLKSAFRNP